MSQLPVIPARFQHEVDQHLVFNFARATWPLVLGIFGRPGDGKSFQLRKHLEARGLSAVSINAADLESDRAGQPGKMVLAQYENAGHRISEGSLAALVVDDFDTTVGEWENSTNTVNHQQVLAQLMHLADSPTQAADRSLQRIPVFVTGNDLSKIYPPLRRPGRMRTFHWLPETTERQEIVSSILATIIDQGGTRELLEALPNASIAFFAEVLVTIQSEAIRDKIPALTGKLRDVARNPDKFRREIEDQLGRQRPSSAQVVKLATELWEQRSAATQSHLKE